MEPIRHTLMARIPTLWMYREDLDHLLRLFDRAGAKVTISDKQYRYDSLDDMKSHTGERITDLDIQAEHPAVHFLLNQSQVVKGSPSTVLVYYNELRTEEISDEADALFYRVRDFLVSRTAPRFRISYLIPAIIAAVGCIVAAGTGGNRLVLETRSNSPSFLRQNKNGIIMLIIGACIGGVVTIAGQWLTRLLFK